MKRAVPFLALLVPAIAHADATVTVTLSPEGDMLAQQIGVTPAELAMQMKGQIDAAYQANHVDTFLQSFTDATSFSARGIGTDYGSAPSGFLAGIAVNVAAAGNADITSGEAPTAGLAANIAVMVGQNLAEWNHPRWTVFANGFYRNAQTERLDGNILSAGAHIQYRLLEPTDGGGAGTAVRWLGLSVTSGIELTRWKLGAGGKSISTAFDVSGSMGSAGLTLDSIGRFDLTSNAVTVPLELTTGLRVALIASVFVGAGIDLTVGNATIDASLDGTMRTSDDREVGTVNILATGDHPGSPGAGRILAGAQVNLWKLKLGAQVNVSLTPAASVGLFARFVF